VALTRPPNLSFDLKATRNSLTLSQLAHMKPRMPFALVMGALIIGAQSATLALRASRSDLKTVVQQPTPAPTPISQPTPSAPSREEDDVVRITTNLVQVDAVIVDKSGKPVTDLKPEEVRIYEDNRIQRITNFSYIGGNAIEIQPRARSGEKNVAVTPVPPVTLRPEDVRRTVALVVDDLGLSFQSIYYVRRALKKFVDEQMQAGDLVAIVRTSGGIGALQQFTADKRQLYAAIDQVKWYSGGRSGINAFAPLEPPTPGAFGAQMDAANAEADQFREDVYSVGTLGAINYVVKGLRELPGRKSVLLISDGFRLFNRDDPTRNDRTRQRLQQLIDQANRASVVIYTMNATGLASRTLSAEDSTASSSGPLGVRTPEQMLQAVDDRRQAAFETQEGLDYLARETGGIAVRNNNDLAGGIKKVMDDQQGYYLIGYRPDQSTFDPKTGRRLFHKLNVKVARPGQFTVRSRTGFYGIADGEVRAKTNTPREQILGALFAPFGSAGVHTQLTSVFANDAKLGSYLRSILYVKASDLTFTDEADGWHKATFDVVAVTFGDNGTVVDQLSRTHELRVRGDTYQNVLKDGFVYFVSFPIKKAGAYQLRAVLRDHDSQRLGSAGQFVEVPDLKKGYLALSGLVGAGVDPKAAQKPPSEGGEGSPAGQADEGTQLLDPQASDAVRHFHTGMDLRYGFIIYNAHLDPNSHQPQLAIQARLFRNGQPVFTGRVQPFTLNNPPDLGRLRAASAIRLGADLGPGEYILQVTVNDQLADPKHRTAIQWLDFEIVK
jgi:VWFA-related protein